MARIFVSYRRHDGRFVAFPLKERIEQRFGEGSVFVDVDNIPVGVDFRKHVESEIGRCHAMLVLIGDEWLATEAHTGKNRLFDPQDPVRAEIEAALARKILIVPVLIGDARMPAAANVPESIQALTFLNAAEVRGGRDLKADMARLVDVLGTLLEPVPATARTSRPRSASKAPPRPAGGKAKVAAMKGASGRKKASVAAKKDATAKDKPRGAGKEKEAANKALPCLTLTSLRRAFKDSENTYIGASIPPVKLVNALGAYASDIEMSDVLLLHDASFFGGAKNGFLLTKNGIYWHNLGESAHRVEFRNLKRIADSGSDVVVNGKSISINDFICAEALIELLEEIVKSKP
jgi:hypothetical protein